MAVTVNAARHQFFTGATFAGDHHGDIAGGNLPNNFKNLLHRPGGADDAFLVLFRINHRLHPTR